jgi:beta-galactosidase
MKYKIFLPVCLLLLSVMSAYAQKSISLNGKWQFQTDSAGIGETQHWYADEVPAFTDQLIVPGNWNTENRYAAYTGKGWYKRTIFIPATLNGKLIRLYFEGVYNLAKVWVNGQFVTENNLGYLQFEKDVSGLLRYGKTNTIVVCADNHFKIGAIWNWGGIRRPVKLLVNDQVYIAKSHVTPRVDLNRHTAMVNFELSLSNTSHEAAGVSGKIELSVNGSQLKTIPFKTNIAANETAIQLVKTQINPGEFRLWNLDDPNLYNYKITLYKGATAIDTFGGRFGLRVVEMDKAKKQLRLNGKVIRPLGFNLVPDDRATGNTLPLWRVKEDIDLMKSLGVGVARMSHMPYHQELLDYLDEKGVMVCEEIPVWGDNNSLVKTDNPVTNEWLRRMIDDHYNHSCIIGWSVGNEIGKNKEVMPYTDKAIQLVKQLDSTRLGVTVSYTAANPTDPLQFSDIGFINCYGREIGKLVDRIHKAHPESTLFLSEFGLGQLNEDLATDFPIQHMMDSLRLKPYLIGASLWTFNDYRSTYKDTKEASQNRPWGLVDVARQKKAAFYSFRKANMPVAGFQANVKGNAASNNLEVNVNIKPRAVFDLPAYELNGYRVVLKLIDNAGKLTGGDFAALPVIHPGDSALNVMLNSKSGATFKANVSLVSHQNYVLYDTVIYFQKPLKPRILFAANGYKPIGTDKAKQAITQVRFEKDGSAAMYKVRYQASGQTKETAQTTASYINITDTVQIANVELVAVNNAGETATRLPAVTQTGHLLPPLIRFSEAADGSFFTGVETAVNDRRFTAQVTDKAGDYTHAVNTVADTKGSFKVSGLVNGKKYYYRVKRSTADGEESAWSEEIMVKPDGGFPVGPRIRGLIRNGNYAVICFEPVKKATGYDLLFRFSNEKSWHHERVTTSLADQYQIKLGSKVGKVEVKLAAINQYGQSVYTVLH